MVMLGNDTLTIDVKTGNIDFSLTGKNVDVIIMDSGVLAIPPGVFRCKRKI